MQTETVLKLATHNKRTFELLDYSTNNNLVGSEKEWCEQIGIHQTNLRLIRNGERNFTVQQMIEACKITGASMDWVCGLSKTMKRNGAKLSAIQLIEEGLRQLKTKK